MYGSTIGTFSGIPLKTCVIRLDILAQIHVCASLCVSPVRAAMTKAEAITSHLGLPRAHQTVASQRCNTAREHRVWRFLASNSQTNNKYHLFFRPQIGPRTGSTRLLHQSTRHHRGPGAVLERQDPFPSYVAKVHMRAKIRLKKACTVLTRHSDHRSGFPLDWDL